VKLLAKALADFDATRMRRANAAVSRRPRTPIRAPARPGHCRAHGGCAAEPGAPPGSGLL